MSTSAAVAAQSTGARRCRGRMEHQKGICTAIRAGRETDRYRRAVDPWATRSTGAAGAAVSACSAASAVGALTLSTATKAAIAALLTDSARAACSTLTAGAGLGTDDKRCGSGVREAANDDGPGQ